MIPFGQSHALWADPRLVYAVAVAAVCLLALTIWLFRRARRDGRVAGSICLVLSIGLHAALIWLVPYQQSQTEGEHAETPSVAESDRADTMTFSTFDPDLEIDDATATGSTPGLNPLPLEELTDLTDPEASGSGPGESADETIESNEGEAESPASLSGTEPPAPEAPASEAGASPHPEASDPKPAAALAQAAPTAESITPESLELPSALQSQLDAISHQVAASLDALAEAQTTAAEQTEPSASKEASSDEPVGKSSRPRAAADQSPPSATAVTTTVGSASEPPPVPASPTANNTDTAAAAAAETTMRRARPNASPASQPGATGEAADPAQVTAAGAEDFAARRGAAKRKALAETGGDVKTEAAVKAALRFLAAAQREDGAWDPKASGAGVERKPLGESRYGAGTKCTTGLTGLALLAMMGAGNTHQQGEYADEVYRGLAYLIGTQKPDGALSGPATIYAASYCHSMAALAMCEAAVMTRDRSAVEASRRAIAHTLRMQHPATGGWRYTRGDPGDLSQLGWQAMVLDAGRRARIPIAPEAWTGVARFLRSVRAGRGGLACYRPGEAASRTMTAEALATRLLIGEAVPREEIAEAQRYLLEQPPGTGQDNYYYWYYATLALHQRQDSSWTRWNAALKRRLLATQRPDGSWPSSTVWGGYGGTVYTTAMATLCLETYYRHRLRQPGGQTARAGSAPTSR